MQNLIDRLVQTLVSTEVAQTNTSSSVALEYVKGFSVITTVTVSTPAAKTFVDADVEVVGNTIVITAHGLGTGLKGQLTTDGVLPTGLSAATDYFVIVVDANTIKLAASLVDANAGTAVNITAAAGGGTHTFTATALAGGAVKIQGSIDDSTFVDVGGDGASQAFTVSGSLFFNVKDVYYRFFRVIHSLTAGQVSITTKICLKG